MGHSNTAGLYDVLLSSPRLKGIFYFNQVQGDWAIPADRLCLSSMVSVARLRHVFQAHSPNEKRACLIYSEFRNTTRPNGQVWEFYEFLASKTMTVIETDIILAIHKAVQDYESQTKHAPAL